MTWIFLQLVFPLLLLFVPIVLYKSSNSYMTRFYIAMLRNKAARRLYLQTLLIVLLLFHYIYVSGHFGDLEYCSPPFSVAYSSHINVRSVGCT